MDNAIILREQDVLGKQFRVYGTIDEPLFVANDVADWIDHSNVTEMLRSVDDDEKLTSTILRTGQNRQVNMLTENGLYEVLMLSRKPIAKRFKAEVKKILKTIRKHGMYAKQELLDNPDLLIAVATRLKEEREKNNLLEQKIKTDRPKVIFADAVSASKTSITGKLKHIIGNLMFIFIFFFKSFYYFFFINLNKFSTATTN